jgi:hypothetical protein
VRNRHLLILCLSLVLAGGSLFLYKWLDLGVPLQADNAIQAWTVEARIRFTAERGRPIKLRFAVPVSPPGFGLLDETFVSHGYGLTTAQHGDQREAVWTIRRARGEQDLYYQAVVYPKSRQDVGDTRPPRPAAPEFSNAEAAVVENLVQQIRAHSADIATFAAQTLIRLDARNNSDIDLLLGNDRSAGRRAKVATAILATANIAARPAYGFTLRQDSRRLDEQTYLEVHNGDRWLLFDPLTAAQGWPRDFLVWSRGEPLMRETDGVRNLRVEFSATENPYQALAAARQRAAERGSVALQSRC